MRVAVFTVVAVMLAFARLATAQSAPLQSAGDSCLETLSSHAIGAPINVVVNGVEPVTTSISVPPDVELLVDAEEVGNDVFIDVLAGEHQPAAVHADNPVRRAGHQWSIGSARSDGPLLVRLTGKEHAEVRGRVKLRIYALRDERVGNRCLEAFHALAAGDASYARGQDINLALVAGGINSRHHYRIAVEEYLRAYELLDAPADAPLRTQVELAISAAYFQDLKDWNRAAEWADRTRTDARAQHLDYLAARAGGVLVNAWLELATSVNSTAPTTDIPAENSERLRQARLLLRELERFHLQRGEQFDAALQLINLGHSFYGEGKYREAEPYYRQGTALLTTLREWPRVGNGLHTIAMCEWGRGDVLKAVATFREAFKVLGKQQGTRLYLYTLVDFAFAEFAAGDLDAALRVSSEALELARKIQETRGEAWAMYGLGVTYYALGDRQLARRYVRESLEIQGAGLGSSQRMAAQRTMSAIYVDEGQFDSAVAADEEALKLADTPQRRLRNLTRLASDTAAAGRPAKALELLRTALEYSNPDDADLRADALIARAHIYRVTGRTSEAIGDLTESLNIICRHDDPDQDFRANLELAAAWDSSGRSNAALVAIDHAIARADELRRQTANPEFRAQRQAPLRPAYDLKLALLAADYRHLISSGKSEAAARVATLALQTAERARAQSLADVASLRYAATDPVLRGKLERRDYLYRDLAARRFGLEGRSDIAGGGDPQAIGLRADIVVIRRELDAVDAEIARLSGIRQSSTREATGDWPGQLRTRAPDVVIVEYWLGKPQAYAWTISRDGVEWKMLGNSGAITEAALAMHAAFREFARRPLDERTKAAAALYDRVVRPLGTASMGHRGVIVVPDGALSYVPFAALRSGSDESGRYLVEDHDVAVAPAAWWLFTAPVPRLVTRPSRVLLLSDPIYEASDPRLSALPASKPATPPALVPASGGPTQAGELPRLPWTAREAAGIASLVSASDVDELSGPKATRQQFLAANWPSYRIIHVASHAIVDAAMPQLSALLLGRYDERGNRIEQAVRAVDLEPLTLQADIVALSACDTAVGRDVAGEGAAGVASTALARGAGAVLASLWPSADEMSARLMTEFYRGVLTEHDSARGALGSAMRSMISRNRQTDPAFWAVYQLSIGRFDSTVEKATHRRSM